MRFRERLRRVEGRMGLERRRHETAEEIRAMNQEFDRAISEASRMLHEHPEAIDTMVLQEIEGHQEPENEP